MEFRVLPIHKISLLSLIPFFGNISHSSSSDCHIWVGRVISNTQGSLYPIICLNGSNYYATRIAYYWYYKIDPNQLCVCHNCLPNPDNSLCVNPLHLWLGDQSENAFDSYAKGRVHTSTGLHEAQRKLSDEDVLLIRELSAKGVRNRDLAKQFDVSEAFISQIIKRQRRNKI